MRVWRGRFAKDGDFLAQCSLRKLWKLERPRPDLGTVQGTTALTTLTRQSQSFVLCSWTHQSVLLALQVT